MSRSTNINHLLEDMITEIFTRLPAKSLGLCKCVSKSWDTLISDPCFIKIHLSKACITKLILISSRPERGLFFVEYGNNNYKNKPILDGVALRSSFSNSKYFSYVWSKVWGSCNGLVLLENDRGIRFLINPETLKYKRLPPQYGGCHDNNIFGFGYDSSHDDHVVVAVSYHLSEKGDAHVFVFELKENKWLSVGISPYHHTFIRPVPGVFFRGYLHWFATDVNDSSLLIAAFDIATKKFSRVPLPNGVFDLNSEFLSIRVLKGCLSLITSGTELWVMKEYGVAGSWIKLPIALTEGSRLVSTYLGEDSLLMKKGGQFVLLHYSSAEEVTLQPMNVLGFPSEILIGMTYVDSLISPRKEDWKKKKARRTSKKRKRLE